MMIDELCARGLCIQYMMNARVVEKRATAESEALANISAEFEMRLSMQLNTKIQSPFVVHVMLLFRTDSREASMGLESNRNTIDASVPRIVTPLLVMSSDELTMGLRRYHTADEDEKKPIVVIVMLLLEITRYVLLIGLFIKNTPQVSSMLKFSTFVPADRTLVPATVIVELVMGHAKK